MTWVKIDDGALHHPKLLDAGPEAVALWLAGLCHCNRHHTDGHISARHLGALYPGAWSPKRLDALASRLVELRLWERLDGDYQVHDYEDYQLSRDEVEADREAARDRQRRCRERQRTSRRDSRVTDAVTATACHGVSHAPVSQPLSRVQSQADSHAPVTPPRPVPSRPVPDPDSPLLSPPVGGVQGGEPTSPPAAPQPPASIEGETGGGKPVEGEQKPQEPAKARAKRVRPAPPPDPVPLPGTPAAAVLAAILADPVLAPITRGPGDWSQRATGGAYPGVDVAAEVRRAGEYAARFPGRYTDGRRYLANWLQRKADEAGARPAPVVVHPPRGIQPPAPASAFAAIPKQGLAWDPFTETQEQALARRQKAAGGTP